VEPSGMGRWLSGWPGVAVGVPCHRGHGEPQKGRLGKGGRDAWDVLGDADRSVLGDMGAESTLISQNPLQIRLKRRAQPLQSQAVKPRPCPGHTGPPPGRQQEPRGV